jgi:hypothetical protein
MKYVGFVILLLVMPITSCNFDRDPEQHVEAGAVPVDIVTAGSPKDLLEFDVIQRACALYVAVRSGSFKAPASFDREIEPEMVRWNVCDGGTMVACASVPGEDGDTLKTGIPWTYDPRLRL